MDHETGEIEERKNLTSFPKKEFSDRTRYSLLYEFAEVALEDILLHHQALDPLHGRPTNAVISWDGVPEAKCSALSLIVGSLKFPDCRMVYTMYVGKPTKEAAKDFDFQSILSNMIAQFNASRVKITHIVADAPMRAKLRGIKQFNGQFGCDLCLARNSRVGGATVYDTTTYNAMPRTHQNILRIANNLPNLSNDERKGVLRKSRFFEADGFDVADGIVCEYMHNSCRGVGMAFLGKVVAVPGLKRHARRLKWRLINPQKISRELCKIRVPTEFSRRGRNFIYKSLKAEEYRNILLFFFPKIYNLLTHGPLKKLWLKMIYSLRANIVPDEDYEKINKVFLERNNKTMFTMWQKHFGRGAMTYNNHVFCCHMERLRTQGVLTSLSAFSFEASYSILKNSLRVGTMSTGKQALQKLYMRSILRKGHVCERKLKYETDKVKSTQRDNSIIFLGGSAFLKIQQITPDYIMHGLLANTSPYRADIIVGLLWRHVGVFTFDSWGPRTASVARGSNTIKGKGIVVGNVIVSVPHNVLIESMV
jgi:hypothetical protein